MLPSPSGIRGAIQLRSSPESFWWQGILCPNLTAHQGENQGRTAFAGQKYSVRAAGMPARSCGLKDPEDPAEDDFGRAVSRILSALLRAERIICLSSQYPKPVPRTGRGAGNSSVSYLALHPMGFSVPPGLLTERWALTPPFHPYHRPEPAAVCFLWHCPSNDLSIILPSISLACRPGLRGIVPCGVRTFLPRLAPGATLHPSKIKLTIPPIARDFKEDPDKSEDSEAWIQRFKSLSEFIIPSLLLVPTEKLALGDVPQVISKKAPSHTIDRKASLFGIPAALVGLVHVSIGVGSLKICSKKQKKICICGGHLVK